LLSALCTYHLLGSLSCQELWNTVFRTAADRHELKTCCLGHGHNAGFNAKLEGFATTRQDRKTKVAARQVAEQVGRRGRTKAKSNKLHRRTAHTHTETTVPGEKIVMMSLRRRVLQYDPSAEQLVQAVAYSSREQAAKGLRLSRCGVSVWKPDPPGWAYEVYLPSGCGGAFNGQ
jgi:hypothetical protein